MVDQSEAPFRLLCRRYNTHLAFTPMLSAAQFVADIKYRKAHLYDCCTDRPLVVQFCCNQPDRLVEAAKLCVGHCDGIDLNLGCPQNIARRGHYGAFLQDEWPLIQEMVSRVHHEVPQLPISCKIRVFECEQKTIDYAQMLERAGCQLLTVHGRTRDQKGHNTGLADWTIIGRVKQSVGIPLLANGNIQSLQSAKDCLERTKVDGIMSAEGLLHNPALFSGLHVPVWLLAEQYMDFVDQSPCPNSYIRGHLFKLFHHVLQVERNHDLRDRLARAGSIDDFAKIVLEVRERYEIVAEDASIEMNTYPVPLYCSQAYFRPTPLECNISKKLQTNRKTRLDSTNIENAADKPNKKAKIVETTFKNCENCANPRSIKCDHRKCRSCCKQSTLQHSLDCKGHRFIFSKRLKPTN